MNSVTSLCLIFQNQCMYRTELFVKYIFGTHLYKVLFPYQNESWKLRNY